MLSTVKVLKISFINIVLAGFIVVNTGSIAFGYTIDNQYTYIFGKVTSTVISYLKPVGNTEDYNMALPVNTEYYGFIIRDMLVPDSSLYRYNIELQFSNGVMVDDTHEYPYSAWPFWITRNLDPDSYFSSPTAPFVDKRYSLSYTGETLMEMYFDGKIGNIKFYCTDPPDYAIFRSITLSIDGSNPVPEPSIVLLLSAGLVGLAAFRRIKSK